MINTFGNIKQQILYFCHYSKKKIFSENFGLILVFISFLVLFSAVLIFCIFGNWSFSTTLSEEKIAQFGDFIGGVVGTLLAFAASVLYYIALKEQQKDVRTNQKALEKQIEEFGNQVEELQLSRKVYEDQQKTMRVQQFETNFYSYFNIYLKVKSSLETQNNSNYFKKVLKLLSDRSKYKDLSILPMNKCFEQVKSNYFDIFISNRKDYDHYFRCLYRLLTIVVDAFPDPKIQMLYIKIVRSQLTDDELLLLYYNTHSKLAQKSKNLVYRFNVLKHLPAFDKIELRNRYQISISAQTKIAAFNIFLSEQLTNYVNLVCDLPSTEESQADYKPLKIFLKLSLSDTRLSISLLYKDKRLIPDNFNSIVADLIFDRLFISTNNIISESIEIKETPDPSTGYSASEFLINIENLKKIPIDLDDNDAE